MAKILVIDDDPKIVLVLKIRLISAGYEVLTAGDGVSGLRLAIEGKPDLVILDIMMPVGGGFSVAPRLREQAPEIPVIFITASKEAGLRQMAEKMGAAGFLEKPYELEAMLALVTEALMANAPSPVAPAQPPESPSTLHKLAPAAAHSPVSPPDTATITGGETILIVEENRKTEMEPFNEHLESLAEEWTAALVAEIARNKRAHDALQQSERNFRNSLEGALDGTVVVDGQGLVVFANAAATNISGRPQEQFLGAPFGWPITAGQIIERDVVNSAGKRVIVEVRTVQTVWQGTPACLVTLRDITERKGAEARMQRRQTALEESNRDLQRRNQGVQAIYHTLSHELKTRLTSVYEFVSSLDARLESVPPSLDSQPVALGEVAQRGVALLAFDDFLQARLEAGTLSLDLQPAPLAEAVERTVATLAPTAGGKGVSLSCDCQPDLPPVSFDQPSILLVLSNLIANAIHSTPAGGQVCLQLGEALADSECLQVAVRDTGCGIPKEQLGLIFNRRHPAHRDDPVIESRSDLDLGLSICRELVQLHGGRIWAESELNQGSTFTFTIPKRQTPATVNVLVVDDEAEIRDALRALLEKQGYQVTVAANGVEALELMLHQPPALVILDLDMPEMDGTETLSFIRKQWKAIPVVIHTAYP